MDDGIAAEISREMISNRKFVNKFDSDSFSSCFKHGLSKVLLLLIKEQYFDKSAITGSCWKKMLLESDFNVDEDVVLVALDVFKQQIENVMTQNNRETKENILHVLIKKGMQGAVRIIISDFDPWNAVFSPDINGNIPLTVAISQTGINSDKNGNVLLHDQAFGSMKMEQSKHRKGILSWSLGKPIS